MNNGENERRKRHGEDQEYAENYEDFERWRVAGDLSPGHGYNFLIAHLHAAHSLLAERFRDTVGMSKASFNDLERDARATGYFVDDTVQRFGRPKPIKLDVKLMYCLVRLRKGKSFLSLEEPFTYREVLDVRFSIRFVDGYHRRDSKSRFTVRETSKGAMKLNRFLGT